MTQPNNPTYAPDSNQPAQPLPSGRPSVDMGKTGLGAFSGRILEDFLIELRGQQGYKRFNEMRLNSPEVGALLLAIENAIRGSVEWHFESEEGDTDPRVEFLQRALDNMSISMNDHISEALTMLPFGYAPFAIWYENIDGEILWHKFVLMGQNSIWRWYLTPDGSLEGLQQMAPPLYHTEDIPIERILLYRTRVERNNPEGRSILRQAWISYYFQKNIQQIEGIGIERDLAGLPMIELPPTANTTDSDSDNPNSDVGRANILVRNVRNDEQSGLVIPSGWKFSLVTTGGTRQFDTDKVISRYAQRILMSALSQFLMLGSQGVGSLALSRDQTDFFTMSVNTTADIIAETFTKYAVPRLLKLNGFDTEGIKLAHTPAGQIDLSQLADFLQKAGAFITWRPEDESWLREVTQLPDVDIAELKKLDEEKKAQALKIAQGQATNAPAPFGKDANPNQPTSNADTKGMLNAADTPADAQSNTAPSPAETNTLRAQFFGAVTEIRKALAGVK